MALHYPQETEEDLWPWPYEDLIKADLKSDSNYGLCGSDKSLTKYVWEYLGNVMPILYPPSSLVGGSVESNRIFLSWNDNADTEIGFTIERKQVVAGNYTVIANVLANTQGYNDTNVAEAEDSNLIKLVNMIISEAIKQRASDIHVEPMERRLRVQCPCRCGSKRIPSPQRSVVEVQGWQETLRLR